MKIETIKQDGKVLLKLEGWLDTAAAPELDAEINAITEASEIVLDFDKVEYIASSGLREVVATHRKAKELGAEFLLINVGDETMNIFKLTGLEKKLNIHSK